MNGRAQLPLSRDFEITLLPRIRLGRSLALPNRQIHKLTCPSWRARIKGL